MNRSAEKADYLTPDVSPVELRLSKRLRSCSKANVSEGVEVFIAGAVAVAAGVEVFRCLAATEEGTKDIIVVEGLGADAGGPFMAGLPGPGPFLWPLGW